MAKSSSSTGRTREAREAEQLERNIQYVMETPVPGRESL